MTVFVCLAVPRWCHKMWHCENVDTVSCLAFYGHWIALFSFKVNMMFKPLTVQFSMMMKLLLRFIWKDIKQCSHMDCSHDVRIDVRDNKYLFYVITRCVVMGTALQSAGAFGSVSDVTSEPGWGRGWLHHHPDPVGQSRRRGARCEPWRWGRYQLNTWHQWGVGGASCQVLKAGRWPPGGMYVMFAF